MASRKLQTWKLIYHIDFTAFITTVLQITIRPETKYLNSMKCVTKEKSKNIRFTLMHCTVQATNYFLIASGLYSFLYINILGRSPKDGVTNIFKEVQVISSISRDKIFDLITMFGNDVKQILVYDRIIEGINSFCANNTIDEVYNTKFVEVEDSVKNSLNRSLVRFAEGGITIWNLFIPKPDIPPAIAANYREVKIEWTKQLVAEQKQKTEKIKKETVLQNAVLDAEREKEISKIQSQQMMIKKETEKNTSDIENLIRKQKEDTNTDIESYKAVTMAEYNKNLLTDQYIRLQVAKSLTANSKVFFSGQDSALGSVLSNLIKVKETNDET